MNSLLTTSIIRDAVFTRRTNITRLAGDTRRTEEVALLYWSGIDATRAPHVCHPDASRRLRRPAGRHTSVTVGHTSATRLAGWSSSNGHWVAVAYISAFWPAVEVASTWSSGLWRCMQCTSMCWRCDGEWLERRRVRELLLALIGTFHLLTWRSCYSYSCGDTSFG